MPTKPLPTAYSQVTWPGVGDIDDCQVIAAFWALVASGTVAKAALPSVTTFRAKAGNPDDPAKADGLNNLQSLTAIKSLYPNARAYSYVGGTIDFLNKLKRGEVASLSVNSGKLPTSAQFGFTGLHQVALAFTGGRFLMMNPLQKNGSQLIPISSSQVFAAATALLNDGKVHAVMVPGPLDTSAATIATLKTENAALKDQVSKANARIAQIKSKTATFAADIADD